MAYSALSALPACFVKAAVRSTYQHIRLGERELRLLPSLIDPGRQAIDVGAHKGLYSMILEQLVGPGNLIVIEPLPEKFAELCRFFPAAHVENVALSNATGRAQITVPIVRGAPRTAAATLRTDAFAPAETARVVEVETRRLDDYLDAGVLRDVGFIKIDVEGFELEVLQGAARVIQQCRPSMLIEIEQRHHTAPIDNVFAALARLGYACFFISPRTPAALASVGEFDVARDQNAGLHGTPLYVANFVCLPAGEARRIVACVQALLGRRRNVS